VTPFPLTTRDPADEPSETAERGPYISLARRATRSLHEARHTYVSLMRTAGCWLEELGTSSPTRPLADSCVVGVPPGDSQS